MKLTIEVQQDDVGNLGIYVIDEANEDTAIMLAFAMDGRFGSTICAHEQCLTLAKTYCSIILWDGKTKAQLEAKNAEWNEKFDRKAKIWDDWLEGKNVNYARPSVDQEPDEIAVQGKCILTLPYDDFWTKGPEGAAYTSRVLSFPTWGEVLLCFEEAIKTTGDYHHLFLEGLRTKILGDVATMEFSTGS